MQSGYWQDLTPQDFAAADPESTIALLPVAAVEQHGPHLPLATDAVIADGIVRAALARLGGEPPTVLVLPPLAVGHSPEHASFAGTLSVGAETLLEVWLDVGRSVARAGIRKLVILNSHGGQTALVSLAALRLRAELRLLVVRANYFAFGAPPELFDERELRHGLHGGDAETSLLLHLRPDLVRREAIRNFPGLPERLAAENEMLGADKPAGLAWMSEDLNPEGVCGNAAHATADKGAAYLDYLAARLARLLGEVARTNLTVLAAAPRRS